MDMLTQSGSESGFELTPQQQLAALCAAKQADGCVDMRFDLAGCGLALAVPGQPAQWPSFEAVCAEVLALYAAVAAGRCERLQFD